MMRSIILSSANSLQPFLPALLSFSVVYILVTLYQRFQRAKPSAPVPNVTVYKPESNWVLPASQSKLDILSSDAPKYRP
jgi:hypothetical protein